MQMEQTKNGGLAIRLTDHELAAHRVSFPQLAQRDEATVQLLTQLLTEAETHMGFRVRGRLLIEAIPLDGGCLLLVTPQTRTRLCIRRAQGPFVYRIDDVDSLLALARGWRHDPAHMRALSASSLYRQGEGYRLVIYPALTFSRRTRRLLETFAADWREGDAAAAFAAEHGEAMIIGNALPRLCGSQA